MDSNFTLDELSNFSQKEKQIIAELIPAAKGGKMESPSLQTVKNVLNYSKALTVRKSTFMGEIEVINN